LKTIRSRWALPLLVGLSLALWASPGAPQPKKPPPTAAQLAADAEGLKLVREAGDLERRKKYTEAIALAEKALAVREKALGADHSSVITTVRFLGELWEKKGEHSRAVPLYERVLAAREKDKGPESIEAAFATEDVARALTHSGDHTRAVTLYQRALALHTSARSPSTRSARPRARWSGSR
jgi:tetratricopeptide (TPR) repeat protein